MRMQYGISTRIAAAFLDFRRPLNFHPLQKELVTLSQVQRTRCSKRQGSALLTSISLRLHHARLVFPVTFICVHHSSIFPYKMGLPVIWYASKVSFEAAKRGRITCCMVMVTGWTDRGYMMLYYNDLTKHAKRGRQELLHCNNRICTSNYCPTCAALARYKYAYGAGNKRALVKVI